MSLRNAPLYVPAVRVVLYLALFCFKCAPVSAQLYVYDNFNGIETVTNGSVSPFNNSFDPGYSTGIAVDTSGTVYSVYGSEGIVYKFDSATPSPFVTLPSTSLAGIAFDSNGRLYVADSETGTIYVIDPSTMSIETLMVPGVGSATAMPTALAFDAAGNLYVADPCCNTIDKFDGTSWSIFADADTGAALGGGVSNPVSIAVDMAGNVFISTGLFGSDIKEYSNTGTYVGSFGDGVLSYPLGIALDSTGNLFVADPLGPDFVDPTIVEFGKDGSVTTVATFDIGSSPAYLAFGPNGLSPQSEVVPEGNSLLLLSGGLLAPAGISVWRFWRRGRG